MASYTSENTFLSGINETYIAELYASFHGADTVPHRFMSNAGQSFGQNRRFANEEHFTGIAMKSVFDDCDIDIDDIAFF